MEDLIGKKCKLLKPLRDPSGMVRPRDTIVTVIRAVNNLDREMFLVQFSDETTSFLFPTEIELVQENG
jgi:hypothetical protein